MRASLAAELQTIGLVLEEMEDLDPERDPQARIAIENTILDYARTALMASAAAEYAPTSWLKGY